MARNSNGKTGASPAIGLGSRVVYHMPWGTLDAVVLEDRGTRGPAGRRGTRIMRIQPVLDGGDAEVAIEVPLRDLTLAE